MKSRAGFIIGGGPSLRGFDFERLRGRLCMTINAAFLDVPWADVAFIGDTRLLDKLADDPRWKAFRGERYTRAHKLRIATKRQPKPITGLVTQGSWSTSKGQIVTLGNSGLSGLNLAELLGWNPIFLLGFDARGARSDGRMQNYHSFYPQEWAKSEKYMREKFIRIFGQVRKSMRAKVYNCCAESALEYFEKITFEEALNKCDSL